MFFFFFSFQKQTKTLSDHDVVWALDRSLPSHTGIHLRPLRSFLDQTVVLNGHGRPPLQ